MDSYRITIFGTDLHSHDPTVQLHVVMAGQIEQDLEKEVTCPLCLEPFKEPKKLPCDHVYCKGCLKGLALRSLDKSISCPECRNVTGIPNNDVNKLPTDFRMNRLVELVKKVKINTNNSTKNSCTVHKDQQLDIYCETCKTMVCHDCVTKEHKYHKCHSIEHHQDRQEKRLRMANQCKEHLSRVHLQISEAESMLRSEETAKQKAIDHAFEDLHKTLEESKQSMKHELSLKYKSTSHSLLKHKQQTESIQVLAAHVASLVNGAIQGVNEELFAQEKQIKKNVKQLKREFDQLPLTVDEIYHPEPKIMSREALKKHLDTSNQLYTPADPQKCQIEGIVTGISETGECYLHFTLVNSSGNNFLRAEHEIKAELRSIRDNTTMTGTLQHLSPEDARFIFESAKRGRNEINVLIRGVHIANSPQQIYIHIHPSHLRQPIVTLNVQDGPAGLRYCGDNIVAVERYRNRILKFNSAFELVAVYGQHYLREPIALTTDSQMNIYVCTVSDHAVHKFDSNGTHIKSTGTRGTLPEQFNCPNGLRVNSREELFVCDSENNRIQVFDLGLNFKRVFGGPGTGKSQFQCPSDVEFDRDDNVYVCESDNHRIQVFTPQEQFVRIIRYKWLGSKEFENPLALCISRELLYVTQTHNITVFKTTGEIVATFGEGILQQSNGLEVDIDGYVYVSSHLNTIFVF